jgi:hypothetical protein
VTRKPRRPGTRGGSRGESLGGTDPFDRVKLPRPKSKGGRLPSDIADAAEAALDDMLESLPDPDVGDDLADELRTQTRSPSHSDIIEELEDDDSGEILTEASRDSDGQLTAARHGTAPPPRVIGPLAPASESAPADRRSKIPLPPPPTTSVHTVPQPAGRPSLPPLRPSPSTVTRPSQPPPRSSRPSATLLRPRSAPTVGDTPSTRADVTTSERDSSLDATEAPTRAIQQANHAPEERIVDIPDDEPVDFESESIAIEERPDLTSLQVVVWEESSQLAAAQGAIAAAGHVVTVGTSGRDGAARAISAIRGGGIDVVVAALPGGESVIEAALALDPRRPIVIAALGGSTLDAIARSHEAGADLALTRSYDVDRVAPVLLAASRLAAEMRVAIAARGAEQMLRARYDEIVDAEPGALLPFEMFQRVLELEIKRAKRYEYPLSVALFAVEVDPPPPPQGIRGILRARAGNALINTIRDIDIATQLDHERFLVLLPYTDLKGSAGSARRVIAAVGALEPVIAGGRTYPPRVVGAVAGGAPGQPMSFTKLMKEATRALEQARRDGAELAVLP